MLKQPSKINIVIFSGGSGGASLVKGLKSFDVTKKAMKITNIVNAYDDGKFTGVVRKVCDVLGPSDIRKNQWTQFVNNNKVNLSYYEFFNKRYSLSPNKELKEVINLLNIWNFKDNNMFIELVKEFFELASQKENISFNDVNISNIIYAMMFRKYGYIKTIEYFKNNFLEIEDDVLLISEDNLILKAITANKHIINSEAEIVNWNNELDPIEDVFFVKSPGDSYEHRVIPKMSNYISNVILEADLIIFAPGTQWSSLIPTYKTEGFVDLINSATETKKILLMNNIQDKDSIGVTAGQFIEKINKIMNLKNISIFINNDTNDELLKDVGTINRNKRLSIYYKNLGLVDNSLHDYHKTALEIFKHYYSYTYTEYKFFDFDDTIYSRLKDKDYVDISNSNLLLLNKISKFKDQTCVIVTGNSYETIHNKLVKFFGSDLRKENVSFDIFADGGVVKYNNGVIEIRDEQHLIDGIEKLYDFLSLQLNIPRNKISFRGDWPENRIQYSTCISIKPLSDIEKNLLCYILNNFYFVNEKLNNVAKQIGFTGIDILNKNTDKEAVLQYYNIDINKKTMYVGDEIGDGNDYSISRRCDYYYNVKSVYDTNILLNVILEDLNQKN